MIRFAVSTIPFMGMWQLPQEVDALKVAVLNQNDGTALVCWQVLIVAGNVADKHDQILEHLHPLHARVIQQGCEEGVFQTEHPLACAEFLLTSIQFLMERGRYPWKREDLIGRIMAIPALMEAQLKALEGSFNFGKNKSKHFFYRLSWFVVAIVITAIWGPTSLTRKKAG